jgi:hypothetical protein
MRLVGLLVAPLVVAGCAGGGHTSPAPHGIYEAKVTVGTSGTRTVWLDVDGGRFRVSLATQTTGTSAFLEATADPAVAILRERIEGQAVRPSDGIADLRRVGHASTNLFAVRSVASPDEVVRQIRVGVAPASGPPPYWLGATLGGKRPVYASTTRGKGFSSYSVSYPGVDVEVEASDFALPECHAKHIALTDGTPAAVIVILPDLGPCQTSDGTTTSSVDVIALATDSHGGAAIVETPEETIMLSGSGVTPKSAVRIARALRPV